jgi:hypothetical protein
MYYCLMQHVKLNYIEKAPIESPSGIWECDRFMSQSISNRRLTFLFSKKEKTKNNTSKKFLVW